MFQNSFQNGNYFQLFDPKIAQDKVKNLYKISNINGNNKIFDKDLKTYVFQFSTANAKITFPRQQKKELYLIQQYIVFQIYFYPGMSWSMQLVMSDLNKTKRRIMLSPTNHKLQIKPFFVKSPNVNFKQGVWNYFVVDLYSFMDAFKGQTYRCLDNITIMGHFKLRRIYTTNTIPIDDEGDSQIESLKSINLLPKNFFYPPNVSQSSHLTKYTQQQNLSQINLYEPTQPSTKNNSSFLKSTKNRIISTPKTQTTKSEKVVQVGSNLQKSNQKQFLANTNGPEMLNRLRKRQKYNESSDSQVTQKVRTPHSTEKNLVKGKKKLVKTQVLPPKVRSSVDNRQKNKIQEKEKIKSKLNPWRTNMKKNETNKNNPVDDSDRGSSPNTTLFKNNANKRFNESSNNKGFQRRSDHYSESEYIELSQKFSTLTDGKFFNRSTKNDNVNLDGDNSGVLGQHPVLNNKNFENEDQIEQNIEMQTNSIYSTSPNKKQNSLEKSKPQMIMQSICDSLDQNSPRKDFDVIGRTSYYGFAQRLMDDYMQERQRPFSPPMNQREKTETIQFPTKDEKQVELMYDPVLNCYYDHKTHTYYELKN